MEQWFDSHLNLFVSLLKRVFPDSNILALFDISVERDQVNVGLLVVELWVDLLDSFIGKILPFLHRIERNKKVFEVPECACLTQHEFTIAMGKFRRWAARWF